MRKPSHTIRAGLCALALGAALATQGAALVLTNLTMVGATLRFGVQSDMGITNQIQCCTNLGQGWWLALTNVVVTQSPYWFVDATAPPASQRFYRVVVLATPSGTAPIPAGSFTMGNCMDPEEGYSDELPLHAVYVRALYMDTNLVSYSLWTNVYQWATNHGYSFDNAGSGKAANHPVQSVSWYDIVKWCNARSEMGGLRPCYHTNAILSPMTIYRSGQLDLSNNCANWEANGYRLPTEAEWEKAARGGAAGHRFPWTDADTIDWSRANYYASPSSYSYDVNPTTGSDTNFTGGGYPYTSPVGSMAPNGYGLCDTAGNVAEWCWDWYDDAYYSSSPGTDPRGAESGSYRVLRGGSWDDYAGHSRCSYRAANYPAVAYEVLGFRCVRGA
jgi:formylglycine-generating enzyme